MSSIWSWDDVPGLDAETRAIATKAWAPPRPSPPLIVDRAAAPAAPAPPATASRFAPGEAWCVWSCDRGAYLRQDEQTYGAPRGQWSIDQAKSIAAARPAGERAGAIPGDRHG